MNRALRELQRRLPSKADRVAAIAFALVGATSLSFTLVSHVGTPGGAALAYMSAVDRADVDYVWSHSVIDSSVEGADIVLLDKAALKAQLAVAAHSRSSIAVESWHWTVSATAVTLGYKTSSGSASTTLLMKESSPHSWPVAIQPAGLALFLPPGAGALELDGSAIHVKPGTQAKLAVFPGLHRIDVARSDLFLPYEGALSASAAFPATTPVTFAGIRLTDQAAVAAKQAVAKAFQACAGSTDLQPTGCPQAYTDVANGAATWKLIGDPTADAIASLGPNGLQMAGHYVMSLSYISLTHGSHAFAVGGPFVARLSWDGGAFTGSAFGDPSAVQALPRPNATDPQVLSALQAQFTTCLKLQAGSDPRCPQSVAAYSASSFVWHANGDPTAAASIVWNGAQGFFQVSGTFDFSVSYDSTPPYSPTRRYQDHSSGQYVADLYWDGTKAVFAGFEESGR